ncbi:hypothetical protein [Variovorax sp. LG9.2]|uniref:hypothetical protein n=1 Tax=Variovorax sp. LG9.2 TaxID=3048626 RepID=UPI002B2255DC|nr:hypothetical protein [Variovorax sp. LG9.2]MEB0057291.1 hypothetical protein [Variovorax sp. LG9.2]
MSLQNPFHNIFGSAVYNQQQQAANQTQYDAISNEKLRNSYNSNAQFHYAQQRADLEAQRAAIEKQLDSLPLAGPTPSELEQYESLRYAWSEYQLVRKLALGGKS